MTLLPVKRFLTHNWIHKWNKAYHISWHTQAYFSFLFHHRCRSYPFSPRQVTVTRVSLRAALSTFCQLHHDIDIHDHCPYSNYFFMMGTAAGRSEALGNWKTMWMAHHSAGWTEKPVSGVQVKQLAVISKHKNNNLMNLYYVYKISELGS